MTCPAAALICFIGTFAFIALGDWAFAIHSDAIDMFWGAVTGSGLILLWNGCLKPPA